MLYKLFFSLNISDFIFYAKTAPPPPGKKSPHLFRHPPLKTEILSSAPFLKMWLLSPNPSLPQQIRGGGAHYANLDDSHNPVFTCNLESELTSHFVIHCPILKVQDPPS